MVVVVVVEVCRGVGPLSHQAGGGGVSMPAPPVAAAPNLTISLSSP